MHGLDLLRSGATFGQEWFQSGRNRDEQSEDIAQGNVVRRLNAVGAVLSPASVSYADLMLVIKPVLIELGPGGVDDPTPEAAPNGRQVRLVGLAVRAGEGSQQMWIGTNEAIPDIEDGLDLRSKQVTGAAQGRSVILG